MTSVLGDKIKQLKETQEKMQDMEALLEVFKALYRATGSMNGLFSLIVEKAISLTNADRGCLMFMNGEKWYIKVALNNHGDRLPTDTIRLSQTAIKNTVRQKRALTATDTQAVADLAEQQSVVDLGIRMVITAPIIVNEAVVALIYLDSATPAEELSARRLETLQIFAEQVAVALAQAQLLNEVRSLPRRLVAAQEAERGRIARELHDEAGQGLSFLLVKLRLLEMELNSSDEKIVRLIVELRDAANTVAESLHQLAVDLRPASLDYTGLAGALRQYTGTLQRHGLNVDFKAAGFDGETRLPPEMETNLYRIVQEALTNAIKHARASRISVGLERRNGQISVTIADNGVGFEPAAVEQNRLGLAGMRERVEILNGTFTIKSVPGAGALIRIEVPHVYSDSDS